MQKRWSYFFLLWIGFQLLAIVLKPDAMILRPLHTTFLATGALVLSKTFGKKTYVLLLSLWLTVGIFLLRLPLVRDKGGFVEGVDLWIGLVFIAIFLWILYKNFRALFLLVVFFLSYLYWGAYIPGPLGHAGFGLRRIVAFFFWGSGGLFGVGAGVSATYLFFFMLFGALLKASGFADLIHDVVLAFFGKSRGGPAKVAVVASALMGTINGSAIANVATTGSLTIPMMKNAGYKARFAAAVEATASTGGQLCPPIMGAVAFVMAEFLGVPYKTVILWAAIPAILYYVLLFYVVHVEASRLHLKGVTATLPKDIGKRLPVLLPLPALIFALLWGFTPLTSALIGLGGVLFSQLLLPASLRLSFHAMKKALIEGAVSAVPVGLACVSIGFIVGAISLSGVAVALLQSILAGLSLHTALIAFLVALLAIVLGMGVPGVAAYVIVGGVAAPLLVASGIEEGAAHLFCLYFAALSNLTPPIALAAYVAAGIAGSSPMKTGWMAVRVGVAGFLLPFYFLSYPSLLHPSLSLICLTSLLATCAGLVCAVWASLGYAFKKLSLYHRLVCLVAVALSFVSPIFGTTTFGILLILFWWEARKCEKSSHFYV